MVAHSGYNSRPHTRTTTSETVGGEGFPFPQITVNSPSDDGSSHVQTPASARSTSTHSSPPVTRGVSFQLPLFAPSTGPASAELLHPSDAAAPVRSESDSSVPSTSTDESTPSDGLVPNKSLSRRPTIGSRKLTEEDIFRVLARRRSQATTIGGATDDGSELVDDIFLDDQDARDEIEQLVSRIFGQSRRAVSAEEKTRHTGVVFRNLTVKGVGIGASLQSTNSDIFFGPLRALAGLLTFRKWRRGKPVRTLIHDFTGVVRPQEMCLVLGRPGSGCSTFLKVIANQRDGFERVDGEVIYGGESAATMKRRFRNEVLYNPEDDMHYPTLTVKETLRFALKTRTPPKESRHEGESRSDYVQEFLRTISKLFWIEHTLGTKVGNAIIRGVSGGEKKRVSIAEAMVTKASCQCWDNSTKGLDASTANEYVSSLRAMTNMANMSTFVALYQAGESLYELFDKVLLIHEGRCAYFGPMEEAKEYFESLGFECPPRWTTADFLTSTTDEHARHVRKGWEDRIPRTAEDFENAYRSSIVARQTLLEIDEYEKTLHIQREAREKAMTEATRRKNYQVSFHKQVHECAVRQFQVMKGDPATLYGKWGGILFQSLIVGSLFYQLPQSSVGVFPRGGIMFFTLLFNSLLALSEISVSFHTRPILLKHKSFSFYRPSAYALGLILADLPQVAVQTLLWSIVIYFMTGLQPTASQFFTFLVITYFLTLALFSFFRAIASFCASLDVASRITGVAIQALVVYTGYLIPPDSMKPWFSWIRHINPVAYSFESIMTNEFTGMRIDCEPPYLIPSDGPDVSPEYQACLIQGGKPGEVDVDGAAYLEMAYNYVHDNLWRNLGIVISFWIFFSIINAIGLEMLKPNKGGAAVTIYKRGQVPGKLQESIRKGETAAPPADEEKAGCLDDRATEAKFDAASTASTDNKIARNEAVFTWTDVTYTIPTKDGPRVLLDNVSGYVRPGRLTALMGESGAGKTTLLNALAQRLTSFGKLEGSFLVDGNPLPISFARSAGFAEQEDVHQPNQTVREALRFSALLRQPPEVPVEEKYEYVERIISLLEMGNIAGATIGVSGAGLNQEQRKLLTLGVELAAKPQLLFFLDEPTSGLDSQAAWNIVRFLRKLADAGQAIICTIHQPSAVLFEQFDDLLLLKKGGQVVYHGPLGEDSRELIEYFESNGARRCPQDMNPAEYMLQETGAGDPNRDTTKDWAEIWLSSPQHALRLKEIAELTSPLNSSRSSSVLDDREFATPWKTRTSALISRTFIAYWRSPEYIIGIFALHILTALFNGFTFFQLSTSAVNMQSRLFSIFMTIATAPPLIQQLQPRFLAARELFTARERASKIYSWTSFVTASILAEIPYRLVAGTLYFFIWYYPVGFPRDAATAGFAWTLIMMFQLYYLGLGQCMAAIAPNQQLAGMMIPVLFVFVVSFCGVVVPFYAMPDFWRYWMYWLSPFTHLMNAFVGTLTHGVPVHCTEKEFATVTLPPSPPNITCNEYLADTQEMTGMKGFIEDMGDGMCRVCQFRDGDEFARSFAFDYDVRWREWGIFWLYIAFNFAMLYVLTWIYLGGLKRVVARWKAPAKEKLAEYQRRNKTSEYESGRRRGEKEVQVEGKRSGDGLTAVDGWELEDRSEMDRRMTEEEARDANRRLHSGGTGMGGARVHP